MPTWNGRRVTDIEWDRLNDLHQDAYDKAEHEIVESLRAEWIAEFGDSLDKFPFKPNMRHVHGMVMKKLKGEEND